MGRSAFFLCTVFMLTGLSDAMGQTCSSGSIVSGSNPDAYTVYGSSGQATESFPNNVCTFNILATVGQRTLILRYQETWFVQDSRMITCGGGYCQNTVTLTLSGPGISTQTDTLQADGLTPPSTNTGSDPPWNLVQTNGYSSTWQRTVYRVIDVSSATQSGAATLQYQVSNTIGYTGSVTVDFSVFRFTMTPTAASFRPRDGREPAVADCANHPIDCNPSYAAAFSGAIFQNPITFSLALPSGVSSYLQGTSTNFGADDSTSPDYVFDQLSGRNPANTFSAPTSGGLSIQTSAAVNSATVTVTSQDYGGRALLTASSVLYTGGPTVNADIFDPSSGNGVRGTCGVANAPAFANLPIDTNCNGIADWWEGQYTNPQGGFLNAADDLDAANNGTPARIQGDGYSVHDEYRGFHVLADPAQPTGALAWISTSPLMQDVFIWNQAALPVTIETLVNTRPNIAYHFLPDSAVKLKPSGKVSDGVLPNNRNTNYQTQAFPLVFVSGNLGGNCNPPPGTSANVIMAESPQKVSQRGPNGFPTIFDTTQIPICAGHFQFNLNAWWGQVVAHETGHNFDLAHPVRSAPYNVIGYPLYLLLPLTDYTRSPLPGTTFFYVWLEDYPYVIIGEPPRHKAETPYNGAWDLSAAGQQITIGSEVYRPAASNSAVYPVTATQPLVDPPNKIYVQTSLFNTVAGITTVNLMNWSPRLEVPYQNYNAWTLSDSDLAQLCLKASCQ